MILILDNYDSFTYNLVQYLGEVSSSEEEIRVVRSDKVSVEEILGLNPSHLVISPGPCTPNEAGISVQAIEKLSPVLPILGVCLGHQAIGQAFGGSVIRAKYAIHGKTSDIFHSNKGIFEGLENPFKATRYHSLVVDNASLPNCLSINAWCKSSDIVTESPKNLVNGEILAHRDWTHEMEIMGFVHRDYPHVIGLQFHPESILTTVGKELLKRFLAISAANPKRLSNYSVVIPARL